MTTVLQHKDEVTCAVDSGWLVAVDVTKGKTIEAW
jgi:hypothetical protein